MKEIRGKKSRDVYYYDEENLTLTDKEGNTIKLYESLSDMSDDLVSREVDWLFHDFYKMINGFKLRCQALKIEGIEWVELK